MSQCMCPALFMNERLHASLAQELIRELMAHIGSSLKYEFIFF
jgi:hypothetical protein